jgi:hypothetical protein
MTKPETPKPENGRKTVTLSFDGADVALYNQLQQLAEKDEQEQIFTSAEASPQSGLALLRGMATLAVSISLQPKRTNLDMAMNIPISQKACIYSTPLPLRSSKSD